MSPGTREGWVRRHPWVRLARRLWRRLANGAASWTHRLPSGSADYWEQRYAAGGTSGPGSEGRLAEHKAAVLNRFISEHGVSSVIDLGCGDGQQAARLEGVDYLGFDVSPTALARCREVTRDDPRKRFAAMDDYAGEQADLALSLDVLYHLVEPEVFDAYLRRLVGCGRRFLAIYSSDFDRRRRGDGPHIRHRCFTEWLARHAPEWRLLELQPNPYPFTGDACQGSFADFYFFARSW